MSLQKSHHADKSYGAQGSYGKLKKVSLKKVLRFREVAFMVSN
jgi:hypothetical protein